MTAQLHVILNDRVLFRPLTGVGHYVAQLLAALEAEEGVAVRGFLSALLKPRAGAERKAPETAMSAPRDGRSGPLAAVKPIARRLLEGPYRFAFRVAARRYALYHEPNHIPIPCGLPTVTTIHDLSVLEHPAWHPADRVRWYERAFDAGVRQTTCFIAASEYTKQQMIARLGVPADRIDVTYQAPRPAFTTPPPAERVRQVRAAHGLPDRFFLFVGTLEPRKNVAGLLQAYAGLPAEIRRSHPLVLVGGHGWKMDALAELIDRHGVVDTTRRLGYLHDADLAALYAGCTALVWPTWYEGFGLPPLEALACGAPVIVSNVTSLPEVVGDAGVLLDPHDAVAWTAALQRMAEDADWRRRWQQGGPVRAATFTWQRCARQTIACYRAALAHA